MSEPREVTLPEQKRIGTRRWAVDAWDERLVGESSRCSTFFTKRAAKNRAEWCEFYAVMGSLGANRTHFRVNPVWRTR